MTQNYDDILPADSLSSSLDKIENRDNTLRDLFAGTSEPSSPVAYQLWADTTNNKIKQRNAANNAWVILGDLTNADLGHLRTDGTNTMAASLNFNSNKGINCTDPTLAQDVATKNYVDTTASVAGIARLYATVDTTAGSSSGLVTPSGSSLPTIAWSAAINTAFSIGTTTDQGKITVLTAGTYFINVDATADSTGVDNVSMDISIRKPAGSTGTTYCNTLVRGHNYLVPVTGSLSTIITFGVSDTFDVTVSLTGGGGNSQHLENDALYNRISMFRLA